MASVVVVVPVTCPIPVPSPAPLASRRLMDMPSQSMPWSPANRRTVYAPARKVF